MKKYAMTLSAWLLAVPGLFCIASGNGSAILVIFVLLVGSWGLLELFISLSRPFEGIVPSHPLIRTGRMVWLLFAVYSWLDYRFELTRVHLPSWVVATLVACYLSALVIRLLAVIHLGPSFSYDVKAPDPEAFSCSGPYRFVRHPSYLGICIMGSLPGLILGSVVGLIGMLFTTLVVTILRADYEDILLEDAFGDSYAEYKRRTYSLIPFVY